MKDIKIEKGIPIPVKSRWRLLAHRMKFGESVLVNISGASSLYKEIKKIRNAKSIQTIISKNQIRVWKIKADNDSGGEV